MKTSNNKNIKSRYDAVVIGSGMGGLLAASFLAKKGYSTCVLERLSFYGGKFTGFNYKGFQIPSGAFHMIPSAEKGGMGRCFSELGLDIKYCYPKSAAVVLDSGKRYPVYSSPVKNFFTNSYLWQFSVGEILSFARIIYYFFRKQTDTRDIKFSDFVNQITTSKRITKLFDQVLTFLNGTNLNNASFQEFKESFMFGEYNKEALVMGGCAHLIDELTVCILKNGGELYNKAVVSKILFKGEKATSIELENGQKIKANLVVSNAGPKRTHELLDTKAPSWFIEKKNKFRSASGIAYSVATDAPLLKHDAVEIPMDYNYISGYVQVSNLDPGLAPPDKHYLLAAQMVLDPEIKMSDAIRNGTRELQEIFPQIRAENIINISSYHKGWAATPTGQLMGQTGSNRYPIKVDPFENLYMLSHDSQGWGFAADIIGYAALNFQQMI